MYSSSWCSSPLSLILLVLAALPVLELASAAPLPRPASISAPTLSSSRKSKPKKGGIVLPFKKRTVERRAAGDEQGTVVGGTVGLGNSADLFYTVAVTVGDSTTAVNLDTGSSDLWVMSNQCRTSQCQQSSAKPYDVTKTFKSSGGSVRLQYGDSVSGTHAAGPVGYDTITLAALTLPNQTLAAINDTDNSAVANGGAGILGLGFPSQSFVQASAINALFGNPRGTDTFVNEIGTYGPIVSRMIMEDMIDDPLFVVTLQRNTIDVSGKGEITIGQLPDGVDESQITWVPVRLYEPSEGGLAPPSFAPNERYPLRWEVEIDAVYLDGQKLPESTQPGAGINSTVVSALIDTGNSLIRGPQDVVNNILSKVSPAFAANPNVSPTLPCEDAHNLTFQIGGKMFPVDPRDFAAQHKQGDATTCIQNNIVGTDAPSTGALFSWNLGDQFLKSNLVVFYYGNLTHPSVDPPRVGFLSLVPQNADDLLDIAVEDAQKAGGNFESKLDVAPTASSLIVESSSGAQQQPQATSASSPTSTPLSPSSPSASPSALPSSSHSEPTADPSSTPGSQSSTAIRLGAWPAALFTTLSLLLSFCIL